MRKYPEDEDDFRELKQLNADDWQVELLKYNPEYVWWGCFEDYMCKKDGWDGRVITPSWKDHQWELDEYNELVNFYFEVNRKSHECLECNGQNLNKETLQISADWYDFDGTGKRWCDKLTEIEIKELVKHGRLSDLMDHWYRFDDDTNKWMVLIDRSKDWEECDEPKMPTPEYVNQWAKKGMGHDAINRWICIEVRAKHLGVYGTCSHCESGYIYDEPKGNVRLQLWYLHPRKGCSRGVYIEHVDQDDISSIMDYLKEAKNRNNNRFSKII